MAIKIAVDNTENFAPVEVDAIFPTNNDALKIFSFADYVTALQAKRTCTDNDSFAVPEWAGDFGRSLQEGGPPSGASGGPSLGGMGISGIYFNGYNWQVPFVKCDSRFCEEEGVDASGLCEYMALGVAPSSSTDTVGLQQAEAFRDFIYERYPALLDSSSLPFDFEFVQMLESNAEVENYVKSKEYGGDIPKLGLAVVFDGKTDPTINYNYAIRQNSTVFNSPELEGRPATTTTPPTDKLFETFARVDDESCPDLVGGTPDVGQYQSSCTGKYAYNGLLTIQRLVHDFIIADSGAADAGYSVSEGGVSFVPFPSKAYVESGKDI